MCPSKKTVSSAKVTNRKIGPGIGVSCRLVFCVQKRESLAGQYSVGKAGVRVYMPAIRSGYNDSDRSSFETGWCYEQSVFASF